MPKFTRNRFTRSTRRPRRSKKKNPWSKKSKVSKYSPKNKKRYINRSNPVEENKKVEAADISLDAGVNDVGNRILYDFSRNPHYLNNEPPLSQGEELAVANLPTGARGVPLRDAVFNFNPDTALYQTHGLDDNSMVGSSVYQKLTAAKFLIRWPQPTMNTGKWNGETTDMPDDDAPLAEKVAWLTNPKNNHMGKIPSSPSAYTLYWGFVKTPTGYSSFTTPAKDTCSAVELERHINLRVEEWYNERTDRISFIPKVNNDLKIIGKRKLSPPWDQRTGRLPVTAVNEIDGDPVENKTGVIPDTMVKITWPCSKKIHFTPTTNFSGDGTNDDTTVFYRNHSWLPCAWIVNWNAATLPKNADASGRAPGDPWTEAQVARDRVVPHILVNDITYYRD